MLNVDEFKSLGIECFNKQSLNFVKDFRYKVKKGMGVTIGNSLRRILLSQIDGYAIRGVLINGVAHEFSSISGVKESVQLFIMNLRKIVFKGNIDIKESVSYLNIKGRAGKVFAADVKVSNLEVVNPELYLCTLDEKVELQVEMIVERGVGHILASTVSPNQYESSCIICDSFFSPIVNVNYEVESIENNFSEEELMISIETNGSISPDDSLDSAIIIWRDEMFKISQKVVESSDFIVHNNDFEERKVHSIYLSKRIKSLNLPSRVISCLDALNIRYIGELVQMTEEKLLSEPKFGQGSLDCLNQVLNNMNLKLGLNVDGWESPAEEEEDIFIR